MKIFISADIEGVAGVVTPAHGQPGNPEYERARRLMTDEVNAAIEGAFEGGADAVVVSDSHGPMVNLLADALDPRAELVSGRPKPMSMAAGLDASFDAVFFTGYHAGAGHMGVLSHTVSGFAFLGLRANGIACAEATLYGAYAGDLGVPVVLLSGDDQLAAQCGPLFPAAEMVVVKQALGHCSAQALSPRNARAAIRAAAQRAVAAPRPAEQFRIPGPVDLEADLASVVMADLCATIPVAGRIGPRTVGFRCADIKDALCWVNVMSALCGSLR